MKNTRSALGTWLIGMTTVCLLHLAAPTRAAANTVVFVTGTFSNAWSFLPTSTITINALGVAVGSTIALSNGDEFFGAPTEVDTDTEYEWDSTSPSDVYELQMIPLTTFDTVIGGGGTAFSSFANVGIYPYKNFEAAVAKSTNTDFFTPEPASVIPLSIILLTMAGMALHRKRDGAR